MRTMSRVPAAKILKTWDMGWLREVGSLKLNVSFAKEPYKRDYILQKRPIISILCQRDLKDDILPKRPNILRSLLIVATPYLPDWLYETTCQLTFENFYLTRCLEIQLASSAAFRMPSMTISVCCSVLQRVAACCSVHSMGIVSSISYA